MAFNPFLIEANFDDDNNVINLIVEHRDDTSSLVLRRSYQYSFPVTAAAIKLSIISKNAALNSRPTVFSTIQALIGSQIS